jgi:two-component system chemotaxis response regulator CheY
MRTILGGVLRKLGFEVADAGDGHEALARLAAAPRPDLALIDWNMPQMDGLELVRRVRSDPANAGLRLVMVTTETESERIGAALEAGADEYVMKPFTPQALAEMLGLLGLVVS